MPPIKVVKKIAKKIINNFVQWYGNLCCDKIPTHIIMNPPFIHSRHQLTSYMYKN